MSLKWRKLAFVINLCTRHVTKTLAYLLKITVKGFRASGPFFGLGLRLGIDKTFYDQTNSIVPSLETPMIIKLFPLR